MTSPPPRRRWLRYSLRTFFIVLTIFGVWLGVQVKWIRDRHEALRELHGFFWTYEDHPAGGSRLQTVSNRSNTAPWSIRWSEPAVPLIILVVDGSAEDEQRAQKLKRLFPEATLEVRDSRRPKH